MPVPRKRYVIFVNATTKCYLYQIFLGNILPSARGGLEDILYFCVSS